MIDYSIHPAADLFPMMKDDELDALAADIKANGQQQPVAVHRDLVLDEVSATLLQPVNHVAHLPVFALVRSAGRRSLGRDGSGEAFGCRSVVVRHRRV